MLKLCCVAAVCLVVCLVAVPGEAMELDEAFSWREVDFNFPNSQKRQMALSKKTFIPENNIPVGIEAWKDKIFLTIPRWKTGVAASLVYFNMDDSPNSPVLNPYPNWEAHDMSPRKHDRLISPFRVRADSCDRLWVIDSGKNDILGGGGRESSTLPKIFVYDLITDKLLKHYTIPATQSTERSFFASIAVDVVDCDNTWGYVGDLGDSGMVVYDFAKNTSWRVSHEYFHMDPLQTKFDVAGVKFQFKDGLFGLALTEMDKETTHRTLFFHPFSSSSEFQVSTKFLRDKAEAMSEENHNKFQYLGTRGPMTQASASFVDEKSGVLFYTQVNHNAVGCWNYHNNMEYSPSTQALIGANEKTMNFPNDLKVDANGVLWVITDKMPMLLFTANRETDANFRVMRGNTTDLVQGTVCERSDADNIKSRFLAGEEIIIMTETEKKDSPPVCRNSASQTEVSTILGLTLIANILLPSLYRK